MDPKIVPKMVKRLLNIGVIFGTVFVDLLGPFWVPKLPKMSQDGLQKPSQIAKIARRSDFENWCFVLFFYKVFWNTRSPKRAPRQPRNLSKWFQGATKSLSKNGSTFWLHFYLKMVPKMVPKVFQKLSETRLKNDSKKMNFKTILDPKMGAKIGQNGQKRPKKAKNDQKWPKCL